MFLTRCGFNPWACQIRCTDALLTPQVSAMRRQLQCVALAGGDCVLATTSASLLRATASKLLPRGRSSKSAFTPPSTYRARQSTIVGRDVFSSLAKALLDHPSVAPRIIRARSAWRCSVLPERTILSSSALSSAVIASAVLLAHMPHSIAGPNHIVKLCVRLYTSGFTPVYPCHVSPRDMRQHPIGTGPFKFFEFKPNDSIKVTRNSNYWKKDRPFLEGIEYTIIKNTSTAILAFAAGKFDMTFPQTLQIPLLKDLKTQMPQAICELAPSGINRNLLVNRDKPPFDNSDLRRAMALSLDRRAFIDILSEGKGDVGGVMQPLPEGLWGMPPEILRALPGYGPDVQKNRREARGIMEKLSYRPSKPVNVRVSTHDLPFFRDPAVILIDQLKEVYIDGELETVDTTNWLPKRM